MYPTVGSLASPRSGLRRGASDLPILLTNLGKQHRIVVFLSLMSLEIFLEYLNFDPIT